MPSAIPQAAGVYKIRCISNGKIYIGSAVNLRGRCEHHCNSLRRGIHRNRYLQNAWNKYGETSFKFSVLEIIDIPNLLIAEQAWLDKTKCFDRKIGFNIYNAAGSPGDIRARVWEGFIAPDGNEITITNLFGFCRQHNLDFPSMHRLAAGKSKLKSYKGWTHKNSVRQREYCKTYNGFITPEGRPAGLIINLAAFCREQELNNSHMVAVAHGRIYSHRGWTYDNVRKKLNPPKTYIGFTNPSGCRVTITNLKDFCRRHGLHPTHMHNLKNGKRKSHKGWMWNKEDK